MPRNVHGLPKYRQHSIRDVAFVVLHGRRVYLPGKFGSAESRSAYRRAVLEWETAGRPAEPTPQSGEITIAELIVRYWRFASRHYVKNGRPTDEQDCIRAALRFLKDAYSSTPAAEFGPLRFKAVREKMVAHGLARSTINGHCARVRRLFRWASAEELVPVAVIQALATVQGLQWGRTDARETDPVQPVADSVVEATLLHLGDVVADMVRLQLLCGMRPMEVVQIRPRDVDRSGEVWRYTPVVSKMQHKGRTRIVYIGPQGQDVLRPYLLRPADQNCFRPVDAEAKRRADMNAARKTPLSCGNRPGTNKKARPKRPAGEQYDVDAYRRAIVRACEVAFGMPPHLRVIDAKLPKKDRDKLKTKAAAWRAEHCWAPNQLRHAAATRIREQLGIESAQHVLGHAHPDMTLLYAEQSARLAAEAARKLG